MCAPWQKTRPNRFGLFVFSSFCFVPVFCLLRQASPLAASPHARRSREIFAAGCGYPKPAGWFSGSRGAAPQARRIAADSCPPAAANPGPVDPVHTSRPGEPCFCLVPTGTILIQSCLVCGDSSGAGDSSCCGRGGHSSHLPPCRRSWSGCWGTLWGPLTPRHAQRKPQLPSLAQEGFLFLWVVLSLSCSCLVLSV